MGSYLGRIEPSRRPTLAAALIGALVLAAGIALVVVTTSDSGHRRTDRTPIAATVSTPAPDTTSRSTTAHGTTGGRRPSRTSPPASSPPASSATSTRPAGHRKPRPVKPITYVVQRGDNLTVIARWFHLHGYGGLYEANKSVIGDNPDLIFPGQRITISTDGMTVGH